MSDERIRILRLVAEGKATPEEAERLLSAVGKEVSVPAAKGTPRYLRVTVNSSDGDKVNIRVPLALVRAGMKFSALVPREAREQMEEGRGCLTVIGTLANLMRGAEQARVEAQRFKKFRLLEIGVGGILVVYYAGYVARRRKGRK